MLTDRRNAVLLLPLLLLGAGRPDDGAWSPLHKAVRSGDLAAVRRLRADWRNANVRGPGGLTPVMIAAGSRPSMMAILRGGEEYAFAGVDLQAVDDQRRDALIHAVRASHFAVAKALVEARGTEIVQQTDRTGRSAFDYAVQQDRFTAKDLERLFFLEAAMWNSPAFHGWGSDGTRPPPTMSDLAQALCAKKMSSWDVRARLAMVFATVQDKAQAAEKRDVVLCAARAGFDLYSYETASALELDMEVRDDRGYTPRMIIALESGVPSPPNVDYSHDIRDAVEHDLDDAAAAMLARTSKGVPKLGIALLVAAKQGKAALVEQLLAAGAPVEGGIEEKRDDTPLFAASAKGCRACVVALLAANASMYPGYSPSETRLLEIATDDVKPLLEAALRARRPDDAQLVAEEKAVASAAFAALLAKHDPAHGLRLFIRREPYEREEPAVPGIVPVLSIDGFLWTSPSQVRAVSSSTAEDTRPSDGIGYRHFFSSGSEVILEKREGRWTALEVRQTWVE